MKGTVMARSISPVQGKVIYSIEFVSKDKSGKEEKTLKSASLTQEQLKTLALMGETAPKQGAVVECKPSVNGAGQESAEWVELCI
jgi:hypothetical protein